MARDEALLESAADQGLAALRFYGWSAATLSLGYFQPYADRWRHATSLHCPCVRRPTGGGAILHDQELTYSLALPGGHPLARRSELLYAAVHESLLECLEGLGAEARLASAQQPREEPFLCFQRRSGWDIVVGTHKIVGSAQRRLRGAILQHGSILLGRSAAVPELSGLDETLATPRPQDLIDAWLPLLSTRLEVSFSPGALGPNELARTTILEAQKYGHDDWTRRR